MKRLLAKIITSTALVLVTFTGAQATGDNGTEVQRSFSPELLRYWEQREAIIAKELKEDAKTRTRTSLRPPYLPWAAPLFTPAQLRYWQEREAAAAKELMNRPHAGDTTSQDSAMEWARRQPQTVD